MTVIATVASKQYTPQTLNFNPPVPAGTKKLVATLTRESWPAGAIGSIAIKYPDGADATSQTFQGGPVTDRNGNVVVSAVQTMILDGKLINGVPQDLPAGNYPVAVVVLQTITTAVTIERF